MDRSRRRWDVIGNGDWEFRYWEILGPGRGEEYKFK